MKDKVTDASDREEVGTIREEEVEPPPPSDGHLGALETDRPGQDGQGNPNLPALDENGQPADRQKICEDVIGANVDKSEGG